jgi:acyl carrier protein
MAADHVPLTLSKEGEDMELALDSRMIELVAEKAAVQPDALDLDRTFEDLGLDSLHLMEIALWVRKEFGVDIPEGDLHHEQTAREGLDYLMDKVR